MKSLLSFIAAAAGCISPMKTPAIPRTGPKFVPTLRSDGQPFANLSRRHPDYGTTPQEHAARKLARRSGNRPTY